MVKGLLESKGYTVLLANDGNEGVEQYQQHQNEIRLVLSDFGLPKLNGFEVYKRMKNINPTVKFILASGFIEAETRSDMLEAGINIILQKPYGTEQMLQLVRSILDVK